VLLQEMLPAIHSIACELFIFQLNSAPAQLHIARETVTLLERESHTQFIGPDLWLSSSPDLNPVNYKI